jgi:cytoskeletal protein CcmA (bactofilin family)
MNHIHETQINMISEGTRIEGEVTFDQVSRIHGVLIGKVRSKPGSTLIISETSTVEGSIDADTLMIDGYVKGDIHAKSRVVISKTGRVMGNIDTPSLILEFGAYFEGACKMHGASSKKSATPQPVLSS